MSFDTPEENAAFAQAEGFPYRLVSDVDRAVGTQYDVLRPSDDPVAMWPRRISYLVDPDGVIRRSYTVTDTAGHAGEVLTDLGELTTA